MKQHLVSNRPNLIISPNQGHGVGYDISPWQEILIFIEEGPPCLLDLRLVRKTSFAGRKLLDKTEPGNIERLGGSNILHVKHPPKLRRVNIRDIQIDIHIQGVPDGVIAIDVFKLQKCVPKVGSPVNPAGFPRLDPEISWLLAYKLEHIVLCNHFFPVAPVPDIG